MTIKTDLDISVGNISFFGDVHIKGNVMEGFSVNAGKNVKIDGSVFGGEITAGGNVTIVGGCINSKLSCDGNADVGFCENAEIFVKGDVLRRTYREGYSRSYLGRQGYVYARRERGHYRL